MKMYNAKYLLSKDVQVVPLNDNKNQVAFKNVTIDDDFIDNNF